MCEKEKYPAKNQLGNRRKIFYLDDQNIEITKEEYEKMAKAFQDRKPVLKHYSTSNCVKMLISYIKPGDIGADQWRYLNVFSKFL